MEFLGLLAIIFVGIIVVRAVVEAIAGGDEKQEARRQIQERIERGLTVRCVDDTFTPADGSAPLPIKEVRASGSIIVPHDRYPATMRVRLSDVTQSESEPYPFFCLIDELSDEDGAYTFDQHFEVPYQFSEIDNMPLTGIPLFALVGPHKGKRKVRVAVGVTDRENVDQVWTIGETTFTFRQQEEGYVERGERTKRREHQIAMLALAISASDGHIDKRETTVIRRFFAEHYTGRDDAGERSASITRTLQQTLSEVKNGSEEPSQMIRRLCDEIREDDDPAISQTAYELCVQVVAADEGVDAREEQALTLIADRLALPEDFQREVREQNLRMSMYDEPEDEHLVGMPAGLSEQEKIDFLNKEYKKWRSRSTHQNPEVASEATLRMERIAKLRRQLSDA